jgi:hypothetical protein
MDWTPLLSTLTGAVIGIAATLIADRNRWRREEARHALEVPREVYTEYVSALKAAGEEIRAVALGDHMSESARDAAVREAVRGTGIYTASERLWLVGPRRSWRRGTRRSTACARSTTPMPVEWLSSLSTFRGWAPID